jgi:hypothetical protein
MAHFLNAISDFFKSIFELFASIFTTAFDIVKTFFTAIAGLFTGIVELIAHTIEGVFGVMGETGKFLIGKCFVSSSECAYELSQNIDLRLIGNAVIIAIIGVGALGYLKYQQQQGRPVAVNGKKLN